MYESILELDKIGNKYYRNGSGRLHKLDGPAYISINGCKKWYKNGKLHRDDGPAVIESNGDQRWYKDGKFHRADGPAFIAGNYKNKWKIFIWAKNGKIHRLDGPAIVYADGTILWYIYGRCFGSKEKYFNSLSEKEKQIAMLSLDFLNG